jgi:hypothetical protein
MNDDERSQANSKQELAVPSRLIQRQKYVNTRLQVRQAAATANRRHAAPSVASITASPLCFSCQAVLYYYNERIICLTGCIVLSWMMMMMIRDNVILHKIRISKTRELSNARWPAIILCRLSFGASTH